MYSSQTQYGQQPQANNAQYNEYSKYAQPIQPNVPVVPSRPSVSQSSDPLNAAIVTFSPPVPDGQKVSSSGSSSDRSDTYSKIKLSNNRQEVLDFERRAELYAILSTMEHLEGAFLRDVVGLEQYSLHCNRLLSQYKTWMDVHASLINNDVPAFATSSGLSCPAALNRIKNGLPATAVHGGSDTTKDVQLSILDIGERFITAMDAVKLNVTAVDELFPLINDILDNILIFDQLPRDHEAHVKVAEWVRTLRSMRASDDLDDSQVRQLSLDLETSYNSFRKFLVTLRSK